MDISNLTGTRKKIHEVMQYINRQIWVTSLYGPAITTMHLCLLRFWSVEDTPLFGGRRIPFYMSQFVSILGNLYLDRGGGGGGGEGGG